ncbi:hypothetical protein [Micromonospora sp. NPDC005413]|uniref:hypothetical protein n=1 Tax=Micromonospora sp. NPDC005413 TaxID=3154563 RepID=UPI0033BABB3C
MRVQGFQPGKHAVLSAMVGQQVGEGGQLAHLQSRIVGGEGQQRDGLRAGQLRLRGPVDKLAASADPHQLR